MISERLPSPLSPNDVPSSADARSIALDDVQSTVDARGIALERVGVRGLRLPIRFHDAHDRTPVDTVGVFSVWGALEASVRGQHLSRFVTWARDVAMRLSFATAEEELDALSARLDVGSSVGFAVDFPWFIERAAPASGERAPVAYDVHFEAERHAATDGGGAPRVVLRPRVRVPLTSLCPCSKAVSDFGAHNQRGFLTVELELAPLGAGRCAAGRSNVFDAPYGPGMDGEGRSRGGVSIRTMVDRAEGASSSPVYALLKRTDERYVTMQAYTHPAFVEDLARDALAAWRDDARVRAARVEAETLESIHAHDAFSVASFRREGVVASVPVE